MNCTWGDDYDGHEQSRGKWQENESLDVEQRGRDRDDPETVVLPCVYQCGWKYYWAIIYKLVQCAIDGSTPLQSSSSLPIRSYYFISHSRRQRLLRLYDGSRHLSPHFLMFCGEIQAKHTMTGKGVECQMMIIRRNVESRMMAGIVGNCCCCCCSCAVEVNKPNCTLGMHSTGRHTTFSLE